MIILRQKSFGIVKRLNKAKRKAWEDSQAGITKTIEKVPKVVDNPGYSGFDEFQFDEFNPNSTRRTAELEELDNRIRRNTGNKKILDPEWKNNVEKRTAFREAKSRSNKGDTINEVFQKKKKDILDRRKANVEQIKNNVSKKSFKLGKKGKIALGTGAALLTAYGAKKLYDKNKKK